MEKEMVFTAACARGGEEGRRKSCHLVNYEENAEGGYQPENMVNWTDPMLLTSGLAFAAVFGIFNIRMLTLEHSPVHSSKEILGGTLVFRGTRVPAQTLLDYINDGFAIDEFIEFFPSVKKQDAEDFLQLIRSDDDHL